MLNWVEICHTCHPSESWDPGRQALHQEALGPSFRWGDGEGHNGVVSPTAAFGRMPPIAEVFIHRRAPPDSERLFPIVLSGLRGRFAIRGVKQGTDSLSVRSAQAGANYCK